MTDYTSPEFLSTPSGSDAYDDLDWHNKIKIKALEGLDQLAANLNAIANVKAIEFQINHLNTISDGFNEQMAAKDEQIATLTTQLNNIGNAQAAQQALLEAEIASLKAANESLSDNFNKFKAVLTSIDQMADEAIG